MTELDIEKLRRATPGCVNVTHFNNAGAGLMSQNVVDTVTGYLKLESMIGGYEAHAREKQRIDAVYDSIARLIGASREEIALCENATRAWDMAFYAVDLQPGDVILTANAEYVSNYIAIMQAARKSGAEIRVAPDDEHGQVSVSGLAEMIDERVKLIALTHVPTSGGLINPAAEVGKIARNANVLYLLDACQSVGQLPIDINDLGCDMLSTTGRKYLRGPRGTGFLYVRKSVIERLEPPFLDLQAATWTKMNDYEIQPDARRFESWEKSYASVLGLGTAVDYALDIGLDNIRERVNQLAKQLRDGLAGISGVQVHDQGLHKSGIVTLTVDGLDPYQLHEILQERGINTSVSPIDYARLDLEPRNLDALLRASVHYYNTEREVDRFCGVIEMIAEDHANK